MSSTPMMTAAAALAVDARKSRGEGDAAVRVVQLERWLPGALNLTAA